MKSTYVEGISLLMMSILITIIAKSCFVRFQLFSFDLEFLFYPDFKVWVRVVSVYLSYRTHLKSKMAYIAESLIF